MICPELYGYLLRMANTCVPFEMISSSSGPLKHLFFEHRKHRSDFGAVTKSILHGAQSGLLFPAVIFNVHFDIRGTSKKSYGKKQ